MSFSSQISLKRCRPTACRAATLVPPLILFTASVLVGFSTSAQAEVIDLRDGARTIFYGGCNFKTGSPQGDAYGWAMTFGDVDGDGYLDFLGSSANGEGPNDEHPPEQDIYLFFGGPRSEIDSLYAVDAPGVADIVFYRGGFSMACADIDGDGYDDVILADGNGYIIFGAPREQLRSVYDFDDRHFDYTPPDVAIVGSTKLGGAIVDFRLRSSAVSQSLVSGDINDDGYADIIIGNLRGADPVGRRTGGATYVIFGRPRDRFPPVFDVDYSSDLPHPDVVIYGESPEEYPFTLAIGDLDGDGIDDLLASTTRGLGEEHITPLIGEIHGFWGRREWKPVYDTQIETFDFAIDGALPEFLVGYQMATGDLDGDGRDELILGEPVGFAGDPPEDRRNMGVYRIYFGRPRGMWPKWSSAIELTDVFILGADTGEAFSLNGPLHWGIAFSLATGNRDGDGYDDLLIGAGHGRRPEGPRTGKAYLLRGRPRGAWPPFIDLRDGYDTVIYGVDALGSPGYQFDLLGYTVGMADIDGSGRDELFIAAQFADGPGNICPDAGEVYVIYDPDTTSVATQTRHPLAARAALLPNYPNPFNPSTTLRFRAPMGETVSLTVYDALGREVSRPLAGELMLGEEREVRWEARDNTGRPLPSGVYFVKLRAGREAHSRKVLLVR